MCSGNDIRCIKEVYYVVIDKDFIFKFYFKKSKSLRVLNEIELIGMCIFFFRLGIKDDLK